MDPALHGGKTRAIQPLAGISYNRRRCGILSLRVLGAILVAGQVATTSILKGINHIVQQESRREQRRRAATTAGPMPTTTAWPSTHAARDCKP